MKNNHKHIANGGGGNQEYASIFHAPSELVEVTDGDSVNGVTENMFRSTKDKTYGRVIVIFGDGGDERIKIIRGLSIRALGSLLVPSQSTVPFEIVCTVVIVVNRSRYS